MQIDLNKSHTPLKIIMKYRKGTIAVLFYVLFTLSPVFASCESVGAVIQDSVEREVGKLDGKIVGESWRELGNRELCRIKFDSSYGLNNELSIYINKAEEVLRFDPNDRDAKSCHRMASMIKSQYNSGVRGGGWYFYTREGEFEKFAFDGNSATYDAVWSDVDYRKLRWSCINDVPTGEMCHVNSLYGYEYAMRSMGSDINFLLWARSRSSNYRVEEMQRLDGCRSEGLFSTDAERAYELRLVNREGERSGFFRVPSDNIGYPKYYIVVEAVDADGRLIALPVHDEESGETELVSAWGLRVPEATYRAVEEDKADDGLIQNNIVGVKESGSLAIRYLMPVLEGGITQWD